MDRLGSYEVTNGKPGFLTFLRDVELKYENDFLMLYLIRSDTGEQVVFPIGPLSDDEAVVLGLDCRLRQSDQRRQVDGKSSSSIRLPDEDRGRLVLQRFMESAVEGRTPAVRTPAMERPVARQQLGAC
jgi:hypothetical protein